LVELEPLPEVEDLLGRRLGRLLCHVILLDRAIHAAVTRRFHLVAAARDRTVLVRSPSPPRI
jgi:hypothetical protein